MTAEYNKPPYEKLLDDVWVRLGQLEAEGQGPKSQVPRRTAWGWREELRSRLAKLDNAIDDHDALDTRRQLVALLAQGCRMARDLGLLTEAEAVAKDEAVRPDQG